MSGQRSVLSSYEAWPLDRAVRTLARHSRVPEEDAVYKTRSQVAEFPNLWIKTKFGLRQFSVRGVAKVRTESLWPDDAVAHTAFGKMLQTAGIRKMFESRFELPEPV